MTGANTLPVMTQFIIDSVSDPIQVNGETMKLPDLEKLEYRLLQIDSDNFAAFVQKLQRLKIWADELEHHCTPRTAASIKGIVYKQIRTYLIGLTAKSSEKGGRLIKDLLEERTESIVNIHEQGKQSTARRWLGGDKQPDTTAVQSNGAMGVPRQ